MHQHTSTAYAHSKCTERSPWLGHSTQRWHNVHKVALWKYHLSASLPVYTETLRTMLCIPNPLMHSFCNFVSSLQACKTQSALSNRDVTKAIRFGSKGEAKKESWSETQTWQAWKSCMSLSIRMHSTCPNSNQCWTIYNNGAIGDFLGSFYPLRLSKSFCCLS